MWPRKMPLRGSRSAWTGVWGKDASHALSLPRARGYWRACWDGHPPSKNSGLCQEPSSCWTGRWCTVGWSGRRGQARSGQHSRPAIQRGPRKVTPTGAVQNHAAPGSRHLLWVTESGQGLEICEGTRRGACRGAAVGLPCPRSSCAK